MKLNRPAFAVFLASVVASSVVASPLVPPIMEDMVYLGRNGAIQSITTRQVFQAGNFVYCSGEPGVQTVDVSDPTDLRETADWEASPCSAKQNGLSVKDGILYVANWSPGVGLLLFGLGNPSQPAFLASHSTAAHTGDVTIFGNLMYVSIDGNPPGDPYTIITQVNTYDVTTPASPVLLNSLVIDDRLITNVTRYGNYIYFGHERYLYVYDVSNPTNPIHRRTIDFNTLLVKMTVHNGYLYVLGRVDPGRLDEGGLWRRSLSDPTNPTALAHWGDFEPRDMHFAGSLCIVVSSGSGAYTLDVSQPASIIELGKWDVAWPGHSDGGYPICVTGSGNHVYVGTDTYRSNPPEHYGARLYSVRIAADPPVIAAVSPNPDSVKVGTSYSKQLTLVQGDPVPSWSVVQGPTGLQVDANGMVNGWQPVPADLGLTRTISIRASNLAGGDTEMWQVRVESRADFDDDEDVDQEDFGILQRCFGGTGQPIPPGCDEADLDGGGEVDQSDFEVFRACVGGAGQEPGC